MDIAIIGASGLLGKYLVREWDGDRLHPFASKTLDIRNPDQVHETIAHLRPDWVVLAAAYTDVDGCESNPDLAFAINSAGAINVAKAAQSSGARLLFLSTDYVFDGHESKPYETSHPRNPQSVYGRSKAQAETGIVDILPDVCIARTSWVFGTGGKCFPATILKLAETRPTIEVVADQRGSPTYARDLAHAIIQLCRKNANGVVHVTNAGDCSWFEFAAEIVRSASLATVVRPTTTEQFPRPAKRPPYSVLSPRSLERYQIQMPSWQDGLREYLKEKRQAERS